MCVSTHPSSFRIVSASEHPSFAIGYPAGYGHTAGVAERGAQCAEAVSGVTV